MKKVAVFFVVAVLAPSLALAWLAMRSLRDQQFLLERQQSLLDQQVTDATAQDLGNYLARQQQEFSAQVEALAAGREGPALAAQFDDELRQRWPMASVGFCVTAAGKLLAPPPNSRTAAQMFRLDNSGFLANREPVEVYLPASNARAAQVPLTVNDSVLDAADNGHEGRANTQTEGGKGFDIAAATQNSLNYRNAQLRNVLPQRKDYAAANHVNVKGAADDGQDNLSRAVPAEAEFRQLIGNQTDGLLARFLQNKLKLMCWHRLRADPDLIFGAELNLDQVTAGLRDLVRQEQSDHPWGNDICLAVLDDNAKPVVLSLAGFRANWKRPFVATEIGDALPHWEVTAYLADPGRLTRAAAVTKLALGLLIAVLVVAIGIGSLLIVRSLNAELRLARQKTDFVSNVSHELKTPLTSIRMFSELLAEGRVPDPAKQRSYLQIITAEAARLTRLINNVLDFSRMERGEKKYDFRACDLTEIVRSAAETFRLHLESAGFQFRCELPAHAIPLRADADAVSQVIVNLLSNAEKYSGLPEGRPTAAPATEPGAGGPARQKEIALTLTAAATPAPTAEVRVLDHGPGVPRGCEEKIFEKFYRAHDSLSSGLPGSGLGLTIARQIARAHGGEVTYEPRPEGGSCFIFRLPVPS